MLQAAEDVITINFNESIQKLVETVDWNATSSAIVVDDFNEIFGIITDSDIAHFESQGRSLKGSLAWELCTHKMITEDDITDTKKIAQKMLENKVHHIIAQKKDKDGNNRACVVSTLDVIDELMKMMS